jgi:hypothetical protein
MQLFKQQERTGHLSLMAVSTPAMLMEKAVPFIRMKFPVQHNPPDANTFSSFPTLDTSSP